MKRIGTLIMAAALILGMASCGMLDVDVDTTLSTQLDIDVEDATAKSTLGHPFTAYNVIDPMEEDDVQEYADNIDDVAVDGIVATVLTVTKNGEPVEDVYILEGTVLDVYNDNRVATYSFKSDWPIEKGGTVSIEDLGGFYNDLEMIILDLEEFTVSMVGESSKEGVQISVLLDFNIVVTGSIF